ncbi:DUF72 domain-containing protein [Parasediminibacterium paludis]
MNFGMIPYDTLTFTDVELPVVDNSKVLGNKKATHPAIYVGLSKWGDEEWKIPLNAPKTKDKDMLALYASHFNTVELNATHYRIFDDAYITKWAQQSNNNAFKFCPKMFNGITHRGSLANKEELTYQFLSSLDGFGNQLGPVFIQLSESFSPSRINELLDFLKFLPKNIQFFIELRSRHWYPLQEKYRNFLNQLYLLNIGLVITDTPGIRYPAHMLLTIPKLFVRFVGIGNTELDNQRLANWQTILTEWYAQGLEEAYFFLHLHNEADAIQEAKEVQQNFAAILK